MGLREIVPIIIMLLIMIPFVGSMAFITQDLYDDEIFENFFIACKYRFNGIKMKSKKYVKFFVLAVSAVGR